MANDPKAFNADEMVVEWLTDDAGAFFRRSRTIESTRTRHQQLEVIDTPALGKMFRLDGCNMTSEADEFFYHENIVHPGLIAQDAPTSALVIGGGDGGSIEELLKHPSMRRVVMAELDADVIRMSREHLRSVHHGALDDPRVEIHVVDAFAYVNKYVSTCNEKFDAIVMDLTDPAGPAEALYTREFYRALDSILHPNGTLALHVGAPFYHRERFVESIRRLSSVFAIVRPYFVHIPLYGASWGMACVSQRTDPPALSVEDASTRLVERHISELCYYNGEIHRALFAIPNYVGELLEEAKRSPLA